MAYTESSAPTDPASTAPRSNWPRWLRRNTMELVACGVIGLGLFMLLQPFAL